MSNVKAKSGCGLDSAVNNVFGSQLRGAEVLFRAVDLKEKYEAEGLTLKTGALSVGTYVVGAAVGTPFGIAGYASDCFDSLTKK